MSNTKYIMKRNLSLAIAIMLLSGHALSSYKITMGTEKINIPEATTIPFNQHTFSTCEQTGRFGPTLSQCQQSYVNSDIKLEDGQQYSVSNGIQTWTVPETSTYNIKAYGAQGGSTSYSGGHSGGRGAYIEGDFNLNKGQKIYILVGQRGESAEYTAGGGGGTFVVTSPNQTTSDILVVAGGGGGGGNSGGNGYPGQTSTSGRVGHVGKPAGINGYGSEYDGNGGWGQSGAGFRGNGNGYEPADYADGAVAKSYLNGGYGAEKPSRTTTTAGGFGGGGSGAANGGGGAGGYSGGGSGGGGGGSLNNGTNPNNASNSNSGEGKVIITKL